jgi:hypothetical protein
MTAKKYIFAFLTSPRGTETDILGVLDLLEKVTLSSFILIITSRIASYFIYSSEG